MRGRKPKAKQNQDPNADPQLNFNDSTVLPIAAYNYTAMVGYSNNVGHVSFPTLQLGVD